MRIGLLEESPALVDFLSTALPYLGHIVVACASKEVLLASLFIDSQARTPLPYDLLILDVILTGPPSALALLHLLDRAITALPLIVITGSFTQLVKQAEQTFPRVSFLLKPFHIDDLAHLIEVRTRRSVQAQ